jgi:hypothetical protein
LAGFVFAACGTRGAALDEMDAAAIAMDATSPVDWPESCSGICNATTPSYPTLGPDRRRGNIAMYTTEPSSGGRKGSLTADPQVVRADPAWLAARVVRSGPISHHSVRAGAFSDEAIG